MGLESDKHRMKKSNEVNNLDVLEPNIHRRVVKLGLTRSESILDIADVFNTGA